MKERKRERKRKEEGREREIDSNWPLHLRQGVYPSKTAT